MPRLLPILAVPPVLGLATWFALPPLQAQVGPGYAFAIVSMPFLGFMVFLTFMGRRAAKALSDVCPSCGR